MKVKVCTVLISMMMIMFSMMPASSREGGRFGENVDYTYEIEGNEYYVDPVNGSDQNDGSKLYPLASLNYALSLVSGGDGIYLYSGDYGDLRFGAKYSKKSTNYSSPIDEVFEDWVTIRSVSGETPIFGHVELGTWHNDGGWYTIDFSQVGNSDLRLRMDGVTITNGLKIYGSRSVDIRNSKIMLSENYQMLTDEEKVKFIGTPGIGVYNGKDVTLYNNEITNVGIGIWAMTTNLIIKDNHIHHNAHDGIQIIGGSNWLIEGNRIHDIDDGSSDADGKVYNRHVDGMQMYMVNSNPKWAHGSYHFTIRNNLIYHVEAMDIMIGGNGLDDGGYEDFLLENNVFCPSNGTMIILGEVFDGLVFRNNTVVYTPNDQWVSWNGRSFGDEFANMASRHYYIQSWAAESKYENYEFYNNLLTKATSFKQGRGFVQQNLYLSDTKDKVLDQDAGFYTTVLPYDEVEGNVQDIMDIGRWPGMLKPACLAVDAGTFSDRDEEQLETDFFGKVRDEKPDIGAFEYKDPSQ